MSLMRAVYITGHGGNEVVEIGTRPIPAPKPGEALLRMKAAGLNRVDLYMRDSGAGITHSLPQIMGLDGVGEIAEINGSAQGFTPGQRVIIHPGLGCGHCEFCRRGEHVLCTSMKFMGEHRDGTMAEFVCVPVENLAPAPAPLSDVEAAALGTAPLTAWRMVHTKGQVKPWDTILIFGIGGSVSLSALQFCKSIGARVIVTSRDDDKLARATALGADVTVNSGKMDVAKTVLAATGGRGVDLVIENVGSAVWPHAMKSLVRGGRIVTCGATSGDNPSADLRRLFIRQLQVIGSTHGTFEELRALTEFTARGHFKPVIDSVYPLAETHAALNRLDESAQFGKIAITI